MLTCLQAALLPRRSLLPNTQGSSCRAGDAKAARFAVSSVPCRMYAGEEEGAGVEAGKYATFWKEFGRVIKLGIIEDAPNR